MIPLRDSIPSHTTPFVNYAVIAICALAFLAQLTSADQGSTIVEQYGMVPMRLGDATATPLIEQNVPVQTASGIRVQTVTHELAPAAIAPWMTLITCMFLHGGWMHFLGNMWFLYVFGDNVEDRLGHIGYVLLYVGTGVAASMAHYFSSPESPVPTIGASGAIAGVMGAYAWLYPHAKVQAILPIPILLTTFVLPAPAFLGIWFAMQMYNGVASGASTGVAWWAHIGGFVAGAAIALVIGRSPLGHKAVVERRF
ncbi:rhomboid family intramembrane serine protease [Planctomycetes bacterium K23_9]|uniref:Rhomboid family protein n=1 Tax=Stieleria marina TaxID=1930275 RepID=A0A517NTY8_9BACT|nr:Rhomboid family protein [Planctomycetes bacterium K23_9]